MAKPPIQVHVSSSDFKSLLEVQKVSLEHVSSMKQMMEKMQVLKTEGATDSVKVELETLKVKKELITTYKDELKTAKEISRIRDEEAEAIAGIAKGMKSFKTMGEKFEDFGKKLKDGLSPAGMKVGLLKKLNVGGIFDKSIEKEKFIKTQQKLGSTNADGTAKTRSQLAEDFKGAQTAKKKLDKTEAAIKDFKESAGGLSDAEFAKTVQGKKLLAEKSKGAEEYAKFDVRSNLVRQDEDKAPMTALKVSDVQKSPTAQFADSGAQEEAQLEQSKQIGNQTELLQAIADNTGGRKQDTAKAKPDESGKESGGLLAGLMSGGAGKALDGMKKFGIGLIAIAGALYVAAEAFKNFGEVAWEDVGKGMVALGGLVIAALALDKVKGNIIAGAAALGVLALATWGIGEALGTFSDLDWETIGKGMVAIAGLGVIGAVAGMAAPLIALGGASLLVMGAALLVIGEAMQAVGKGFSEMTDGLEKIGKLDGSNLLLVGAGLASIGAGMAALGVGTAVAGVTNLVSGFLHAATGQKSPVEQIMMLGEKGDLINQAGTGVVNIARGLGMFSQVDPEKIKAIAALPIEKIAAMGASLRPAGAVEGGSRANADANAAASGGGGNKTNIVNAPVNNMSRTTNVIKPNVRNNESSNAAYGRRLSAA
jgi:hypothetical protein